MALFAPHIVTPDSALGGKVIEKSLRFNGGSETTTPQLRRTGTTTSSSFTISMWAKLSRVSDQYKHFFSIGQENDANAAWVSVQDGQNMGFQGGNGTYTQITRLFRDPTSWFHFLISVNSNNFTVYIDGTSVQTGTIRSLDTSTNGIRIGANYGNFYPWNGYLADVYLIDGQAKAPTDFGYTESQTGMWRPKQYTGTFGTADAHLEFKDSSSVAALGKDTSGNGNDFSVTTDGFNVTAGVGNDSSEDTPSNNFCTLNPQDLGSGTLINGNLNTYPLNAGYAVRGTNFVSSGKWYFEFVVTAGTNMPTYAMVGIQRDSGSVGSYSGTINIPDGYGLLLFGSTSYLYNGTTATAYNIGATSFNDVIGVAFDLDKGEIYFYRDGSLLGGGAPAYSNITQGNYAPHVSNQTTSNNDMECFVNFGQRPFAHTPPTGYRALNSRNLATPSAAELIKPQRHFETLIWDGNSTQDRNITGLEFKPDFVWIKSRSHATYGGGLSYHHLIWDVLRGVGSNTIGASSRKELTVNENYEQGRGANYTDYYGHVSSFNEDGFQLDHVSGEPPFYVNQTGRTYVAWCWKAGGGSNTFNVDGTGYATASAAGITDGSIALTGASVNREAGFSMVTYAGTGSAGTVGHGLGKKPTFWLMKNTSDTSGWFTYYTFTDGSLDYMYLDTTAAKANSNASVPTTTTVGATSSLSTSGDTWIVYAWTDIPGYSKFGVYTGNGSANGPFIHLGFRPALFIQKKTSGTGNWYIFDNKRSGFNVDNDMLTPNLTDAEYDGQTYPRLDFVSNGIKWVDAGSSVHNASGETYIYMAFAERPSGTIFGVDANAR